MSKPKARKPRVLEAREPEPFRLTRVALQNYRSIVSCRVELGPLTALVGPNGAGKSNFLDALRFTGEALRLGVDAALDARGGLRSLARASHGHPLRLVVRLDFRVGARRGSYAFAFDRGVRGAARVAREECIVGDDHFDVRGGDVVRFSHSHAPRATTDGLYLTTASGFRPFDEVHAALRRLAIYHLNPDAMRSPLGRDPGALLLRDGSNVAAILRSLPERDAARVTEYLGVIVPGLCGVRAESIGGFDVLGFEQVLGGETFRFDARQMSDGTLRALGILIALFQPGAGPLIGIEEPELAVHPGALDALLEAMRAASESRQIVLTSHSPELLGDKHWSDDQIRVVELVDGATTIGAVDEHVRKVLRDRLFTPGELLVAGQLLPARPKRSVSRRPMFTGDDV